MVSCASTTFFNRIFIRNAFFTTKDIQNSFQIFEWFLLLKRVVAKNVSFAIRVWTYQAAAATGTLALTLQRILLIYTVQNTPSLSVSVAVSINAWNWSAPPFPSVNADARCVHTLSLTTNLFS